MKNSIYFDSRLVRLRCLHNSGLRAEVIIASLHRELLSHAIGDLPTASNRVIVVILLAKKLQIHVYVLSMLVN